MEIVASLLIAGVGSLLLARPLKKAPAVFYALAVLLDLFYLGLPYWGMPSVVERAFMPFMQRGLLAFGLFAVVMFVGVLPAGSSVRQRLVPVRGPLSIVAAILVLGHVINYAASYLGRVLAGGSSVMPSLLLSFGVSSLLVVLLAVLTVTSFQVVRARMSASTWKAVQKWAYVFFGLIYLHVLLALGASALSFQKAGGSLLLYTVIFGLYVVLRVARQRELRQSTTSLADEPDLVTS